MPEWNAARFIRGKNPMYTHIKKLYELSFSPVYSETTVRNGYMDRTYIEKNSWYIYFLWILQAHNKYIYFQDFYKVSFSRLLRVPCPPPLYSVIQWLYIEALWTVKLQCLKVTKIWVQCLFGNKWRNVLSIVTIAIWEID